MRNGFVELRGAWIEWELLRVLYNALMIVQGLLWLFTLRALAAEAGHAWCSSLYGNKLYYNIIGDFVFANFCYCAGPLLETYLFLGFGRSFRWGRRVLVFGLLIGSSWMVADLGVEAWRHIAHYR
jgi:hypothetical protein